MTVFERNIEALRRRQPDLAVRVSACVVGPSLEVRLSEAGPLTLVVLADGKDPVLLHSAKDPIKEARLSFGSVCFGMSGRISPHKGLRRRREPRSNTRVATRKRGFG